MGEHHGHHHGVSPDADARPLRIALGVLVGFVLVEFVLGLVANSVALVSDAAHMLTDALALVLSLVAISLAARPARGAFTYGLGRSEAVSAAINGATLVVLGAVIVVESVSRLVSPPPVAGGLVLVVALCGIVVNAGIVWLLSKANRESLVVEGSYQHLLTDLYAFVGTALAAVVIILTGWDRADPVASLLVAALMLRSGWTLLVKSGRVMLEAAPAGLVVERIADTMLSVEGVREVHDLHVWEIGHGFPALSAHVEVERDVDVQRACEGLRTRLESEHGLSHTTLQVQTARSELVQLRRT